MARPVDQHPLALSRLARPPAGLSRRGFLAGAAGLALLAACGGGDDEVTAGDEGGSGSSGGDGAAAGTNLALGVSFPQNGYVHLGAEQRLPFVLFVDGSPARPEQAPEKIDVHLLRDPADATGDPVTIPVHADGVPRAYFPLRHEFPSGGVWYAVAEVEGQPLQAAFQVEPAEAVSFVKVGDPMPLVETPTFDDARGVTPICTREPQCPLHDVSLAAALDENRPVALLISTPAFCQTAICGPVLDLVLPEAERRTGIHFLHAEVFVDPTQPSPQAAPVMTETGLSFEPAMFLIGADGVVRDRLDVIFDRSELTAALDALES